MSEIMSYSLKYYPDPGIAFDISKMLFVKLNSESVWKSSLTSIESSNNEIDIIKNNASLLPDPEQEVSLFLTIPNHKSTTFLASLISNLIKNNLENFSFSNLANYLSDINTIKNELILFYLGNSVNTPNDFEHAIRFNRNITDKTKILLFGFILNPNKYIDSLIRIIDLYSKIIKSQYLISNISESSPSHFVDVIIENTYSKSSNIKSNLSNHSISYSLSFTTPIFLFRDFTIDKPYFITTVNTINHIDKQATLSFTNSLLLAVNALNDKHRLSIISHLSSHKSLSLKELSKLLNLSTTTTNHHLSVLHKANVITLTKRGRSNLYSYNPSGFEIITKAICILEKGGYLP